MSTIFVFPATMVLLIATSGFGQAVTSPPPSYRFASGGAAEKIPIEVVADGLVLVQARVNDHPGWFILDNGSQGFTIDRGFARENSLQSSGNGQARGGGASPIEVGIIRDVQISLPGMDLTHRVLIAIDLRTLEPSLGHTVDGIIGTRLFDDFVVAVDFERCLMAVYEPNQYQPPPQATALPVRIDKLGFQYIDATIALPETLPLTGTFLIDGGSNAFADLYKPFCDTHHVPPAAMKLLDEPGTSTGGRTESRDGRADRISVGPFSVANPPITFAQDVEGLMAAKDYSGSIGSMFLERFTVVFDNPGKRVWLMPNRNYEDPADYDESGLRVRAEGPGFHKFVVNRVVPQSSAAEAGFDPGDVVESIDHYSTKQMTLTEIRKMLCRPNARYSVNILRANRHLRLALKLRPLL